MISQGPFNPLRLARLPIFMLIAAVFCVVMASTASAQVIVYRIDFSKSHGVNFNTFTGGYFAAPVLGGSGSFLLTSKDEALTFVESDSSGTLFTAVSTGGDKTAVISATTGSSSSSSSSTTTGTTSTGTASGAFVALGTIDHTLHVDSPTVSLSVKVANSLIGMAVSADTESTASAPAADGSLGSAGYSTIQFVLDQSQTDIANKAGLSLSQTMDQLKLVLEREGFAAESSGTDTTTGTGTDTGTTGTTGTTTTGTTTTSN